MRRLVEATIDDVAVSDFDPSLTPIGVATRRPNVPKLVCSEARCGILGQVRRKHLQRDLAIEAGIHCQIYLTHAAVAQRPYQPILRYLSRFGIAWFGHNGGGKLKRVATLLTR